MILQKLIPHLSNHVTKSKLKGVITATVTALLIPGAIHPPKVKYSLSGSSHPPKVKHSLQQLTISTIIVTITILGPSYPPKVKYSLKFQIPAQLKLGQRQTSMMSFTPPSQSDSEATRSVSSTETSRITTSSQTEMSTEISTEYNASSKASSRETSKHSSPESGNLTVRSLYLLLKEMAILHKSMHDAIHAVREQQGRPKTRNFFQQQQEVAANKLRCLTQIQKTSTPDPPPPKSNAFPRRSRARSEKANGTTSSSSEESDCENPRKVKFLALKKCIESSTSSDEEAVKHARFPSGTSTSSQK